MPHYDLVIHTDGACSGNPGPGGWGFVARDQQGVLVLEDCGGEPHTTNNRMEIQAAICAAEFALLKCQYRPTRDGQTPRKPAIVIHTDSKYLQQGITMWMASWINRGWTAQNGAPIKNKDLWCALNAINSQLDIAWEWVKGHGGDVGNERADELARLGCDKAKRMVRSQQVKPTAGAGANGPAKPKRPHGRHGRQSDTGTPRGCPADGVDGSLCTQK